ncbi:MAG: hypothetical protein A2W00_15415 [Candidatus Eisenbacteria bacterium RBG_16_71_46]|nr:MAG: hypothetical protein A2W00_15415 [Candidatus Eisenbacteria bacterium RBG_16_71_46]OGF22387.1 MAG: hypothetical protein A2V63_02905 [Candidatus Eisenbacteria bacterium RBG_19FT_COMBO_70_11]
MSDEKRGMRGFTLLEIVTVVLIMGVILGFSIPALQSINKSYQLKGASENLVGQIRLSRQKAISEDHQQQWTFDTSTNSYKVQDLTTSEWFGPFEMPKQVAMESVSLSVGGVPGNTLTCLTDGRFNGSGDIVLKSLRGDRDTVTVQMSGLVLFR